jgi:hypothetical protein
VQCLPALQAQLCPDVTKRDWGVAFCIAAAAKCIAWAAGGSDLELWAHRDAISRSAFNGRQLGQTARVRPLRNTPVALELKRTGVRGMMVGTVDGR